MAPQRIAAAPLLRTARNLRPSARRPPSSRPPSHLQSVGRQPQPVITVTPTGMLGLKAKAHFLNGSSTLRTFLLGREASTEFKIHRSQQKGVLFFGYLKASLKILSYYPSGRYFVNPEYFIKTWLYLSQPKTTRNKPVF